MIDYHLTLLLIINKVKNKMIYIYVRVSTKQQSTLGQRNTLVSNYPNHDQVFEDHASGKDLNRVDFERMSDLLISGDKVVIYDISRLGRSTQDLLTLIEDWNNRGVNLVVHDMGGQSIDTSTPTGKLMFTMFAAVSEMQRTIQAEKAAIGMTLAVKAGKMKGGRPHKTAAIEKAVKFVNENGLSKKDAALAAGVGIASLYRALAANKDIS